MPTRHRSRNHSSRQTGTSSQVKRIKKPAQELSDTALLRQARRDAEQYRKKNRLTG